MAESAKTIRDRIATVFPPSMLTDLPGIERLTKMTQADGTPLIIIVTKDEKCFVISVRDQTKGAQAAFALARQGIARRRL